MLFPVGQQAISVCSDTAEGAAGCWLAPTAVHCSGRGCQVAARMQVARLSHASCCARRCGRAWGRAACGCLSAAQAAAWRAGKSDRRRWRPQATGQGLARAARRRWRPQGTSQGLAEAARRRWCPQGTSQGLANVTSGSTAAAGAGCSAALASPRS